MANQAAIDSWLKYVDQTARTPEERERMRADVYKRFGVEAPKRKRGGLAGFWDKYKGTIVPVASGLAGLLTGGAAAPILTGAVLRGADTGSLKGALRGAGEGALAGLGGAAIKGAYLGGAAGTGVGGTLAGAGRGAMQGAGKYLGMGGGANGGPAPSPGDAAGGGLGAGGGGGGGGAGGSSKLAGLLKPEAIGGITAGLGQAVGGYMEREAAGERLDFEKEQRKLEEERANRLAQLLAPMAGAQAGLVGSQYGGYGRMG